MDNRAIALKLILDHLETTEITSVDQRMEVQKAVYLAQTFGVALGYSYGWYLKGPYSPSLTRDYYSLSDENPPQNASLKDAAVEKLDRLKQLMNEKIDGLARPQRLELLASLHYLLKSSSFNEAKARQRIGETKPHIAEYANLGLKLLRKYALI